MRPVQSSDYAATFGPEYGQAILDDLKRAFWFYDTTYQPGIGEVDLAWREGQRSVIVQLVATVEAALHTPDEVQESYRPSEEPHEDTHG